VLHWPLSKTVRLIRGEKGTTVVLVVIPAADPTGSTTKQVDLVRDEVKLEEQAADAEVREIKTENDTVRRLGVIDLPAFYANMKVRSVHHPEFKSSAYDVNRILTEMDIDGGVDGLLLDLRNNGGGSLLEAIRMTGLFIRTGPTVQVREKRRTRVLPDRDPSVAFTGPIVVLVNRLSASASEIVAGALQDYGRAVIVGDARTHGKGTVQSIVELGRDRKLGAVKITTASYHRISGGSTQLEGVHADIVIPSPYSHMELGEDALPNPIRCDPVQATPYDEITDLRVHIPALRRRSEERRAADPRFATYRRLLDRVRRINQTEELPLDLASRRKMANVEKELNELQESLAPLREDPQNDEATRPPDLVLEEGLNILADLVAEHSRAFEAALKDPAPGPKSITDTLSDWFHKNL
jgi:carboxyl-terminal processing protease